MKLQKYCVVIVMQTAQDVLSSTDDALLSTHHNYDTIPPTIM